MSDEHIQLKEAVERMHGGTATLAQSVPVREAFEGKLVWEGVVHVFDLTGHPTATRAYAWSAPIGGGTKRRRCCNRCQSVAHKLRFERRLLLSALVAFTKLLAALGAVAVVGGLLLTCYQIILNLPAPGEMHVLRVSPSNFGLETHFPGILVMAIGAVLLIAAAVFSRRRN
jgi:hypothetical protein